MDNMLSSTDKKRTHSAQETYTYAGSDQETYDNTISDLWEHHLNEEVNTGQQSLTADTAILLVKDYYKSDSLSLKQLYLYVQDFQCNYRHNSSNKHDMSMIVHCVNDVIGIINNRRNALQQYIFQHNQRCRPHSRHHWNQRAFEICSSW